jgi:hypothetical protein
VTALVTKATVRAIESSGFHGATLIAAVTATVLLVLVLVELQFLAAVDRNRTAPLRRSLGIAVPPLILVLVAVLAVRVVSLLEGG